MNDDPTTAQAFAQDVVEQLIPIKMLEAAAKRCDGYLMQYGLEVVWSLTPIGLKLEASWGADKFERYVHYQELSQARFDPLERVEQAALAGLSS